MSLVTAEQLNKAVSCGAAVAAAWAGVIDESCKEFQINTPARIAPFIAQIAHESVRFHYVQEIASGAAYDNRADLWNTKVEAIEAARLRNTTPGRLFKGRGLIQITGYKNYLLCGFALDYDLITNPELLELPRLAALSAGWFWKNEGLNELADAGEFVKITKAINGGTNGFKERRDFWISCKGVWQCI